MNLFLPDSGLVIWMLIAFIILFVVLAKFAWPGILKSVSSRQEHIEESLRKAEEAAKTLESLEEKGNKIIADAQAEQLKMVQETKNLNKQMIAEAKAKAESEAAKIIEAAQEQIKTDKENAIKELRKEVAALSIEMAEKVLKKELSDKKAQTQYINTLLAGMDKDTPAS
ncbi:MAG: F0F1 ATP synthase subunit B [Paludibacteraceae bacterium]|nr:F0F1 ATP synthase subunit B [Paludibacteraceae bacterium]